MRSFILLCILLPVSAAAFDEVGIYSSLGAFGCPDYVAHYDEDRADRPSSDHILVDHLSSQGWLLGYLTAYNSWIANGRRNVAEGLDEDEIESWVADYCREHLLDTIGDAMMAFVRELEASSG
jgi:hypothetical protein